MSGAEIKPVVLEMAQACTFPDCDCDSPYRAAGACVKPAQAADRAVQLPPLPDGLLDEHGPIWGLIDRWGLSDPGREASEWAGHIDTAIKQAMQDYARAAVAALPAAPMTPAEVLEAARKAWPKAPTIPAEVDAELMAFVRLIEARAALPAAPADHFPDAGKMVAAPAPAARVDAPSDAVKLARMWLSTHYGDEFSNDDIEALCWSILGHKDAAALVRMCAAQEAATAPAAAAVPVPHGWRFYSADFSMHETTGKGAVMLTRDEAGKRGWLKLPEIGNGARTEPLYASGTGRTLAEAIADAAQHCTPLPDAPQEQQPGGAG